MEQVNMTAMTQTLEEMIKNAFERLSCARFNNGLFAELEELAKEAYRLGVHATAGEDKIISKLDISGDMV
jgi:hypothetical protein